MSPTSKAERQFPAFHLVAKPTGALCNLDCTYCFYLEKETLYPGQELKMSDAVLQRYISQYIDAQQHDEVHFLWQGGEPTLMGLEFFQRVAQLQREHANGKTIHNALQTNGLTLDESWCRFLLHENWLVGISIDGPSELHDCFRVTKGGQPTHAKVVETIERLRDWGVRFNALVAVHSENAKYPLAVYQHLKDLGAQYIQFLPIVERHRVGTDSLATIGMGQEDSIVTPWSVDANEFGDFLIEIFDVWIQTDVGQVFVQIFDTSLESWLGVEPSLCIFRKECGNALAVEHNGDVYSCDHFVFPKYLQGNLMESSLLPIIENESQREFGRKKATDLPQQCLQCDVLFACRGECPKNRFLKTDEGDPNLNYLCAGYLKFFHHIDPTMRQMAEALRA